MSTNRKKIIAGAVSILVLVCIFLVIWLLRKPADTQRIEKIIKASANIKLEKGKEKDVVLEEAIQTTEISPTAITEAETEQPIASEPEGNLAEQPVEMADWKEIYGGVLDNLESVMDIYDIKVTLILTDITGDGEPELFMYNRYGTHEFCGLAKLLTIKDGNYCELKVNYDEDVFDSENPVFPYYVNGELRWIDNLENIKLMDESYIGYEIHYSLSGLSEYEIRNEELFKKSIFEIETDVEYTQAEYERVWTEINKYELAKDIPYAKISVPVYLGDDYTKVHWEHASCTREEFFSKYEEGKSESGEIDEMYFVPEYE